MYSVYIFLYPKGKKRIIRNASFHFFLEFFRYRTVMTSFCLSPSTSANLRLNSEYFCCISFSSISIASFFSCSESDSVEISSSLLCLVFADTEVNAWKFQWIVILIAEFFLFLLRAQTLSHWNLTALPAVSSAYYFMRLNTFWGKSFRTVSDLHMKIETIQMQ